MSSQEVAIAKKQFSSREFNREPGRIKRAAQNGPVIITERGEPALAVISWAEYCALKRPSPSLLERISVPGLSGIALETERAKTVPRAAKFD